MPPEAPGKASVTRSDTEASARRSRWRLVIAWGVFVLYVLLIEYWLGWTRLLAPWRTLDIGAVLIALLLFLLTYVLRAHRVYDYFHDAMRGGWLTGLRLMIYHNALNNLLPMRSGELSFPLLMKRYFRVDYGHSLPALLWFRLLDLHSILLIGGVALLAGRWPWVLIAGLAGLWLTLPYLAFAARARLRIALVSRPQSRLTRLLTKALEGLPASRAALWRSWLLTWVNWLVKLLVLAWVLTQFVRINLIAATLGAIGGELTSVLPFHAPAGVGTYEAGIVAVLVPFGLSAKDALNAAVNAHLFVLGAALASAALTMLVPHRGGPSNRSEARHATDQVEDTR
jgi:uncharacterized membrane protein YbhN (UPF0104 family)